MQRRENWNGKMGTGRKGYGNQKYPASVPQVPGGVLEVYMTGGSGGASYCKPKKIHKPEILDPKKYLASKFPTQKNTRLKYLNTDLFN